jgi:hypothetical protein
MSRGAYKRSICPEFSTMPSVLNELFAFAKDDDLAFLFQ